MGKNPKEIYDSYTVDQAFLIYESIVQRDEDHAYITARMVWAIANGWKRPQKSSVGSFKKDLEKFKGFGMVEEK